MLVAAVAVGAVIPAVHALDAGVADAESTATTELAAGDLSLASTHAATVQQASYAAGGGDRSARTAVMPFGSSPSTSSASSDSSGSSSASAGDADDVASLTKAMEVTRENGPLEFSTPYEAGDEDSLDGQISKALGMMGLPQRLAPGIKNIIMKESTGRADVVNNWDSNAAAGTPSKGLMQLIDTTFDNAVLPSLHERGIFDPVANITAGVRTMIANHDIQTVMDGGRTNSSGNYIGYGGAKVPSDGLGRAR